MTRPMTMTHVNVRESSRADSGSGFLFVLMNSRSRRSIAAGQRARSRDVLLKGKVVSHANEYDHVRSEILNFA